MKKILCKIMSGNKQRGIALLFALAILSLLMVMAMGFATSAIFEQKAAYNSANTSSARILAQSVLNRVLVLINKHGNIVQSSHVDSGDKDMLDHLSMDVDGAPLYTWAAGDEVTWEYLTMDDGPTKRLLGRFAYKVIPLAGLDPGALVNPSVNEALNPANEKRLGVNVDEINMKSISSDIVATSPTSTQVSAQKFNYTTYAAAPGLYPGPVTGWQSFQNLFKQTGVTDEALQSKMLRWFMLDSGRFKSKEAYQVNTTPDQTFFHRFNLARTDWNTAFDTKDKMFEKILLDSNGDGIPDFDPANPPTGMVYSNTVTSVEGYGIPWLAYFGYKADGTLDTTLGATFGNSADGVRNRRRQIAANLVDYCSSSATPTSDVAPASWGTTDPAFTGNKRTPYLNELGLQVKATGIRNGGGNNRMITVTVSVAAAPELIDIYGFTTASNASVTIYYTISYNFTGTSGITVPVSVNASTYTIPSIPIYGGDWGTVKHYATPTGWATIYTSTPINNVQVGKNQDVNILINNLTVNINKVVLSYNSVNVDCAKINAGTVWSAPISFNLPAKTPKTMTEDKLVSFQVNDPRQNLNAADWTKTETATAKGNSFQSTTTDYNSATKAKGTLDTTGTGSNAKNKINGTLINPAAGPDGEGSDPAYNYSAGTPGLSTAYIRQGPMQSPWELGLIHRGKAWETINLKEYDANKNFKYIAATAGPPATPNIIPGGGAYTDPTPTDPVGDTEEGGDANILNQIKMNSTVENFKVNINSEFQEPPVTSASKYTALEALFTNIRTGCTNILTPETGTPLSAADISGTGGLIPAIVAKANDYTNRAQVVNDIVVNGVVQVASANRSNYNTDAKKEEIIGKFVNLTDVGGKYYYVIVLAQAIKDVGGTTANINIKKTKNGVSSTKGCRMGVFDFDSVKGIYFDEIVSEQKIKVLMYEPLPGSAPTIVSYEFVE